MTPESTNRPAGMFAAALIAGLCAVGACAALSVLSAPADWKVRKAAVQAKLERIRTLEAAAGSRPAQHRRTVCRSPETIDRLPEDLRGLATKRGLTLDAVAVGPPGATANQALSSATVKISAHGSYEGALGLLEDLSNYQPTMFADTIDLQSRTSAVDLKFAGQVYCRNAVHP